MNPRPIQRICASQYILIQSCSDESIDQLASFVLCLETDVTNGGKLPAVQLPASAGEGEELDKDVAGCNQDWAIGAVPAK